MPSPKSDSGACAQGAPLSHPAERQALFTSVPHGLAHKRARAPATLAGTTAFSNLTRCMGSVRHLREETRVVRSHLCHTRRNTEARSMSQKPHFCRTTALPELQSPASASRAISGRDVEILRYKVWALLCQHLHCLEEQAQLWWQKNFCSRGASSPGSWPPQHPVVPGTAAAAEHSHGQRCLALGSRTVPKALHSFLEAGA